MRRWGLVLAALALSGLVFAAALRVAPIRADIASFLPEGETPAARLMLQELRQGTAGGVLLVGVEGAPVPDLARITTAMAAQAQSTGLFRLVAAGQAALPSDAEREQIFARRYLLTDAPMDEAALHEGMVGVLRALRSSAGSVALQYGLADPAGAFAGLLRGWGGAAPVRVLEGAWFDRARDRALLVAATRAGALDGPAQSAAVAALRHAFATAAAGTDATLLLSGPAVFAAEAAAAIQHDVELVSIASTLLVAGLLAWRFRSWLVLAAIGVPLLLGLAAAVLVTAAVFGMVNGAALGLGAAMAGIAVDYPVLLIGHRRAGEAAEATLARIGPAFVLAVATAVLGLGGMVLSGLPGLEQLGVFAATALAATAAATWWVLPRLVVAADLAPVAAGDLRFLPRVERARRGRAWALLPACGLLIALVVQGGPQWETDLAALSPVPDAARVLDQQLRTALGAAEAGQFLVVRGPSAEAVLQRQEALQVEGAEYAAQLLPSVARQERRRAALPGMDVLAARVDRASTGLPFQPGAFQPFLDGVAATATLAPLRPADLDGTALGARLLPLLSQSDIPPSGAEWTGPVRFRGPAAYEPRGSDVVYVDVRAELGAMLTRYTSGAWRWLTICAALAVAALAWGVRADMRRLPRVLGPVLAAVMLAGAALSVGGARLSLVHVVALQLVAGVGFDYAVFFSRPQLDDEERARTLRTLVTCNVMTLLTFGALACCRTPFLHDIGLTVVVGAAMAMVAAFLFAGPVPDMRR